MESKNNGYENIEDINDIEKGSSSFIKITDFIMNVVNSVIDITLLLLNVFMFLYKLIVRHTLLISVILVVFGYLFIAN